MDRTEVALLGAALVLLTQTLDQEEAVEAIDFNTIGLLVGMMLIVEAGTVVGLITRHDFFRDVAQRFVDQG